MKNILVERSNIMTKEEVIKQTIEAVREYDAKQRAKSVKSRHDRRLRNTRLLLKHYNYFRDHVDNAIYSVGQINAIDALDEIDGMNSEMYIKSIKKSASLTHVIMSHVKNMIDLYEVVALRKGESEQRKFRVMKAFYIDNIKIYDIAINESVAERTCTRDLCDAINTISALIFGIDSVHEMIE
jgi:hypothetical protein